MSASDANQKTTGEEAGSTTTTTTRSGRIKIESIEEFKDSDKTKLGRSYTIWVSMKHDKQAQQSQLDSYESLLKPVASFNTVIYLK
jgi:hypothetical protein